MDTLVLDWETYYDTEYSLDRLTTEAYVRDPRFEEILIGVKQNDAAAYWLVPDRFRDFAANEVDWANTALITHHAHFDGFILSHHHGHKPALHIDTLSLARVLDGPKAKNGLAFLGPRHGFGEKGDAVHHARGKHYMDFTRDEYRAYGDYCVNDCELTYALAMKFVPLLPYNELRLADLTIRMFTEPVFHGDVAKLRSAVATERQNKIQMLQQIGLLCPKCNGTGQQPDLINAAMPCKKCDGMGVNKKPLNSNDQFADLLRKAGAEPETKTSPTTGEPIYAFAKTDSYMQALVEDEDDEVRVLAETRLAVKSNIIETRAAKFAACAERGPMPVYLSHAGAHTLRPSGGDGMNWLNMSKHNAKRPEMMVLRQSILPPPGHKILAPDSGQGEARIVAWLANQHDLVEAFAQGRDIYSEAATDIYKRPVDRKNVKEDYIAGQVGKICLGEGTLVLTQRGWVSIEDVQIHDQLWDGEEWIRHQGLVFQGVKYATEYASLWATPDHEILTEHGWQEWNAVHTSLSLFQSALNSANLPVSNGNAAHPGLNGNASRVFSLGCAAPVGGKVSLTDTTFAGAGLPAATIVPRKNRFAHALFVMAMKPLARINRIATGFARALVQSLTAAQIRGIVCTPITAVGAFAYSPLGLPTVRFFSRTLSPCLDGINQNSNWIEPIMTGGTNPAICASALVKKISKTSAKLKPARSKHLSGESKNSKQRMRTYDLACAGPRSRFTVLTDRGPIIVHNCILSFGFGSGWYTASIGFLKGVLGAPPIQFFEHDLNAMQIDPAPFFADPKKVEILQAMPSRLDFRDRAIHCAVVWGMVQRYRERYAGIKKFWATMETVINAMMRGEEMVFGAHGVMRTGKECIYLPNGTKLNYRSIERDGNGDATYWDGRKRTKIYGSLCCENVVQALHRAIVAEQMLEIADAGIKVALWPYDEIVAVVPDDAAELALEFMIQTMKKSPAWATGLPLTAEGKIGNTYAEC